MDTGGRGAGEERKVVKVRAMVKLRILLRRRSAECVDTNKFKELLAALKDRNGL